MHFVYNTFFLLLLAVTYLALGLPRAIGRRLVGAQAFGLLTFALLFQGYYEVEH